jgi:hypothetical protein
MGEEQRIAALKAEIQTIAWTNDLREKFKLMGLKKELFRLCAGHYRGWQGQKGELTEWGRVGYDEFLQPLHAIADALSAEDSFD